MSIKRARIYGLFVFASLAGACGGSDPLPSAPAAPTPRPLTGAWEGTLAVRGTPVQFGITGRDVTSAEVGVYVSWITRFRNPPDIDSCVLTLKLAGPVPVDAQDKFEARIVNGPVSTLLRGQVGADGSATGTLAQFQYRDVEVADMCAKGTRSQFESAISTEPERTWRAARK